MHRTKAETGIGASAEQQQGHPDSIETPLPWVP